MRKQKRPSELGFNRFDKRRLQRGLEEVNDKRTFLRLKAVLLCAEGMSVPSVAKLFDKSFQIVYRWVKAYVKQHCLKALFDAPRSGRPLAAQEITDRCILKELEKSPLKLGYYTNVWTVALLAQHLNTRYGSSIRPRTLYRRMKAMGLRSKRPRYVYSEKDPNRAQKKGSHRTKAKRDAPFSGAAL